MKKRALIVWGGWEGHEPEKVSEIFKEILEKNDYQVEVSTTLDSFLDAEKLKSLHLIIPVWTMGKIENEQLFPVLLAVANGTGIAGCHGGMGDSFRDSVQWQFMVGGQWVAHPGGDGTKYRVNIKKSSSSPIIKGLDDFDVTSEQYYMQYDPAVEVLATTRYPVADGPHAANGEVDVPVIWTKLWGRGRVFYTSLGHHADIFDQNTARTIIERGFLWASEGKDIALSKKETGLSIDDLKKAF
jgi:uncharacterized protein